MMTKRIIATLLFLVGAILCYGAGKLLPLVKKVLRNHKKSKNEDDERLMLDIKLFGYAVILVGLLLLFL